MTQCRFTTCPYFLPRIFGRSSPVAILFRGTVARAWDLFDTRDEFSIVMCFADFCRKWLTKNPHMAGKQRKGIYFNVYFLSKCWHSLNVNYYNIWYNFSCFSDIFCISNLIHFRSDIPSLEMYIVFLRGFSYSVMMKNYTLY